MMTHAQQMIAKAREYSRTDACFLTNIQTGPITIKHEPNHPVLQRPRWVVTCPEGTSVSEIAAAFQQQEWPSGVFDLWMEKNGEVMVKKGTLTA